MAEITANYLVQDSLELFSLPDIYFQLREMINSPRFSMNDIALVIAKDPALSARVLKIGNSTFYGDQARIDTISRAVAVMGNENLRHLVFATTIVNSFNKIPNDLMDMTSFWLRSLNCAVIAQLLAKKSAVLHCERLFLAGLLHDIGSLILYAKLPGKSLQVLLAADHKRYLVADLEQEIIGFTHADVGAELIKSWGLPDSLSEAVLYYLTPEKALMHKLDTHLLFLATRLTDSIQQNKSVPEILAEVSDETLSIVRLGESQIAEVINQADEEFEQMFELIAIDKRFH
ncbi:HDOD domain-containing protein [Methylobacter luteus]|uniref:HDOD domain-containing protein n=1 Tax=Methylobacter luteus TaxID=415 RepID=UPI0003FAAA29|nr:HDOD domain-containing protein [Methylobacter luteus]